MLEGYGYPLAAGLAPEELVDRAFRAIRQIRVLVIRLLRAYLLLASSVNTLRRVLRVQAPNESLMVVSCCANVALTVWGPGYGVHLSCVALEGPHGLHGIPEIEDHHIVAVLLNGGQLVDVSLVPCDSEQRLLVGALVNDGAVLEVSQVKVPH